MERFRIYNRPNVTSGEHNPATHCSLTLNGAQGGSNVGHRCN
jgi:hypothetical protein